MQGIPNKVKKEFLQNWMQPRVSEKRYKHVAGVAKVAKKIARAYGCDQELAEIAAWLHDCCKEVKDKELVVQAREFGIPVNEIEERYGHLLHGPVGAQVARRELGVTNEDVLNAVAEHTLGNVPMSKLSEVLFLADCLEESRPKDYTDPIWNALDIEHECNVEAAIVKASDLGILHLMETGRAIHPRTIECRNYYLEKMKVKNSAVAKA
jgi:predicted HD superfamily hydrolase involved in NAD metabolism